jgi:hypothetical protein
LSWHFVVYDGPDAFVDVQAEILDRGTDICAKVHLEMEHRETGERDVEHDVEINRYLRAICFEHGDNVFWFLYGVRAKDLVALLLDTAPLEHLPAGVVEVAERRWGLWLKRQTG